MTIIITQNKTHSFQVFVAKTSNLYLGKVPLTIINHMQARKILKRKTNDIYSKICTAAPTSKAVKTKDSIRTKAIIAFVKRVSFSKGFLDKANRKHPNTTPVARAAMLTGNIMKAKTVILAAFTKNILTCFFSSCFELSDQGNNFAWPYSNKA